MLEIMVVEQVVYWLIITFTEVWAVYNMIDAGVPEKFSSYLVRGLCGLYTKCEELYVQSRESSKSCYKKIPEKITKIQCWFKRFVYEGIRDCEGYWVRFLLFTLLVFSSAVGYFMGDPFVEKHSAILALLMSTGIGGLVFYFVIEIDNVRKNRSISKKHARTLMSIINLTMGSMLAKADDGFGSLVLFDTEIMPKEIDGALAHYQLVLENSPTIVKYADTEYSDAIQSLVVNMHLFQGSIAIASNLDHKLSFKWLQVVQKVYEMEALINDFGYIEKPVAIISTISLLRQCLEFVEEVHGKR